jgi:hypothetical protein
MPIVVVHEAAYRVELMTVNPFAHAFATKARAVNGPLVVNGGTF